jgi:histidyl-tRNA synthetase
MGKMKISLLFKDNGDRDVAMRYTTVPLARFVAQNQDG